MTESRAQRTGCTKAREMGPAFHATHYNMPLQHKNCCSVVEDKEMQVTA